MTDAERLNQFTLLVAAQQQEGNSESKDTMARKMFKTFYFDNGL